jgi:hypothetical protein
MDRFLKSQHRLVVLVVAGIFLLAGMGLCALCPALAPIYSPFSYVLGGLASVHVAGISWQRTIEAKSTNNVDSTI